MFYTVTCYETNVLSAGGEVRHQTGGERFAVILYDVNSRKFEFSARHWNNRASSYICQLRQGLYRLTFSIAIYSAVVQKTRDLQGHLRNSHA